MGKTDPNREVISSAVAADSASAELLEYREEISAVVHKQLEALAAYTAELESMGTRLEISPSDALLLRHAMESIEIARKRLNELLAPPLWDGINAFNELIKHAVVAFRASVAARTLLIRHTPTLRGFPQALDPAQHHRLNPGGHIIDYARNAYHQYQDSRSGAPRKLVDNPVLSRAAQSAAGIIYQHPTMVRPILFSSAMGAIDSLIDLIVILSRDWHQQFVVGQRCWFEIGQYVRERFPEFHRSVDENDTDAILHAIESPDISAIILEPLGNHPDMAVVDLDCIAAKLLDTSFDSLKIIVLDVVHTPDLDVYARYFSRGLPRNLCIALVISGVKFLQAGWDISKSGLVALYYDEVEALFEGHSLHEKLIDIRSVTGRAPSIEESYLADMETSASFRSRLRRYDRNTRIFAGSLDSWLRRHDLGYVTSPWLQEHQRHEVAISTYGTGGRILFVNFNPRYFEEAALGEMFKLLAERAERESVSLMAAPSFGLASPHVHVVIRPGLPTTLRISTGSTSAEDVRSLLVLVCQFLLEQKTAHILHVNGENQATEGL